MRSLLFALSSTTPAALPSTLLFALPAALLVFVSAALPSSARGDDPFLRRTHTVRVVDKVGPAVVNITTEQLVQPSSPFGGTPFDSYFFRDFFEPRAPRTVRSLGSGVLFDPVRSSHVAPHHEDDAHGHRQGRKCDRRDEQRLE